jgi:hypothetical protein
MLLTEWNQDEAIEVAREEGEEIGMKEEKQIIAKNLLAEGSTPNLYTVLPGCLWTK